MYRTLVPVDTSEERAEAQATAVLSLPAAADAVEATVLHVTDGDAGSEPASVGLARDMLAESGVSVETRVRSGDPAEAIVAAATDIDADLIVMGGRKRSPLGSLLFGSVSQAVMADAARPVTITGTDVKEDPTHVCQSCGERYHVAPDEEIQTCRACGGVEVEPVT